MPPWTCISPDTRRTARPAPTGIVGTIRPCASAPWLRCGLWRALLRGFLGRGRRSHLDGNHRTEQHFARRHRDGGLLQGRRGRGAHRRDNAARRLSRGSRHRMARDPAAYSFASANAIFDLRNVADDLVQKRQHAGFLHFIEDVDHPQLEMIYGASDVLRMAAGPGRVQRGTAWRSSCRTMPNPRLEIAVRLATMATGPISGHNSRRNFS